MKFSPENLEIFALQKKTEETLARIKESNVILSSESLGKLGTSLSNILEDNHEYL